MRKLLVGIVAVALLGLLAAPAMAVLDTADVLVSIEVLEYGAIEFNPDPTLQFDVAGPYDVEPPPTYGNSVEFKVRCNLATDLVVTAPDGTSEATAHPGEGYYPHATGIEVSNLDHLIGFGVALTNLTTTQYAPWNEAEDGHATVSFAASQVGETFPNARITCNSYMDSARGTDALAPQGEYTATLLLTLSASS